MKQGKNIGLSVLAGLLGGALFAAMAKGALLSMFGFLFSLVPVIMAGLAFGAAGVFSASAAGLVLVAVLTGGSAAPLYLIWDLLPAVLLVLLLLKNKKDDKGNIVWYPIGYALSWLSVLTAVIGILTVMMMLYVFGAAEAFVTAQAAGKTGEEIANSVNAAVATGWDFDIANSVKSLFRKAISQSLPSVSEGKMNVLDDVAAVFMALTASAWFMRVILAGYIAQYLLLLKGKAVRPKPDYTSVYIQNWLLVLVGVAFCVGMLSTGNAAYISFNFAVAVALPFCILGLSCVHVWAKAMPHPNVILFIFYALLTIAFLVGIGIIEVFGILAVIGLYEQIVRIYVRYIKSCKNGGK